MDKRPRCLFAEPRRTTVLCMATWKLYPIDHCEKCVHHIPDNRRVKPEKPIETGAP